MNKISNKNGLIVVRDWNKQKKYNGFDGKEVWPNLDNSIELNNGLASIEQFDKVLQYKRNFIESRLLYIQFSHSVEEIPPIAQVNFNFVGYDYGNYISEYNYYSLILHEIISGKKEKFKNFEKYLNDNLLFNSLEYIPDLEKIIIGLKSEGQDLEEELRGQEFQPISIYSYKEKN